MFQSKNKEERIPAVTSGDFFTEEISIEQARYKINDYSEELNSINKHSRRRKKFILAEIQHLQKLVNIHEQKQSELGADFKPLGFW